MGLKENHIKTIRDFKSRYGLDATEENVVTTIHLMNTHQIDKDTALDQSSLGANDNGIDGWYYDLKDKNLYIYQSKLTDNKGLVLRGLKDLLKSVDFLEKIIIDKEIDKVPTNKSIYNLYIELSKWIDSLKKISFVLISPLNENDLIDSPDYEDTENQIRTSRLFKFIIERNGKVSLHSDEYNFERTLPISNKKYSISKLENSVMHLRDKSYLEITFIPIYNLILLYRQRGDILFHKNIRLSLYDYKDAKNRVVTPMENTLKLICEEQLSSDIFPFYHIGVTISATVNSSELNSEIELETPYVINGCQTITIADRFLRNLENKKAYKEIDIFKKISVLAKVVIGTSDDELKEITNCNNRQNPIENWQLFSNDPIHIQIENAVSDCEILYERQKGKLKLLNKVDVAKNYSRTNNTFIEVQTLGQLIALVRGQYQWAAKPSEIFTEKQKHDSIFTKDIPKYPRDIILCHNLFKALKAGLNNYLKIPAHYNDETWSIFNKPIVKAYVYRAALLYHYQRYEQDFKFANWLYQKASSNLVDEFESIYRIFISKAKTFYLNEQKKSKDVSSKKLTTFFDNLYIELGIDIDDNQVPFTVNSIDWSEEENEFNQGSSLN